MYLNVHSYYSLRFGTFSEETLVKMAKQKGYDALALTDINNTSAALHFYQFSKQHHIKPILGIDFRNGSQRLYTGIALSNKGFYELNQFLSNHLHNKTPLPLEAPFLEDTIFIYPFEVVLQLDKQSFGVHERIGVDITDKNKIAFNHFINKPHLWVLQLSCSFRNKTDFNVHRLLRAIDNNVLLSKLDVKEQAAPTEVMQDKQAIKKYFKDFPFLWKNTQNLIEQANVSFNFETGHQNKKVFSESKEKDKALLRHLCYENLPLRYPTTTPEIIQRIENELATIEKMDYVPFFLVNWDIISYARKKNYFYVGRGSGANSIVAYLLQITDVDPMELNLYFERFMNIYRSTPPDFDLDFSWRDREDVTRYIFDTYGKKGEVALIATYTTFKHKAAIRELGKVFGLPNHEIEALGSGAVNPKNLDGHNKLVYQYANLLKGKPNLRSVHAGGILIAEKSIHNYTATDLPPKGFPTTHFDMVVAEKSTLFKYDILGQRGLGKIKEALEIIRYNHPEKDLPDLHNTKAFIKDKKINRLLKEGNCIGCFYVESPAMRMLIRKLKVENYLLLVAASSIIRPGVSQSGMMTEYIKRHHDPERRKTAHPVLLKIMEDTYGVMVYQEDVIKVAHLFAGLGLGEADVLRRGMSGKYRSKEELQLVKDKFFSNCQKKGYPNDLVNQVWKQIESFAGYAFAKGHSASYAVESYQSLYLKHYHPLEYMVAVINNGGGYYSKELYFHEARMNGGLLHAPCVNTSHKACIIIDKNIYLGFELLYNLQEKSIDRIIEERQENGNFTSLQNFIQRVNIGLEQLDLLIRINAFRFTGVSKRNLLWEAHALLNKNKKQPSKSISLFPIQEKNFVLPTLKTHPLEEAFDQIELLGFPLCDPFLLSQEEIPASLMAKDLCYNQGKVITVYGYLVTVKNTRTKQRKNMYFGTFLDQEGHWIDTVHFPPIAKQYPFTGKGIYELTGKVNSEFGFYTIEIIKMRRIPFIQDQRFTSN